MAAADANNTGEGELQVAMCRSPSRPHMELASKLQQHLPYPWIVLPDNDGLHILLLSRDEEKAVQRRAYFSLSGVEKISVHRKPLHGPPLESILSPCPGDSKACTSSTMLNSFLERVVTVIGRLRMYEVCVGVHEREFEPLWAIDKGGEIDKNYFGELRYNRTFRPYACHLLVNCAEYVKKSCPVCIKTKIRFRKKIKNHKGDIPNINTPNVHLNHRQLLSKVSLQRKKLHCSQSKLSKLKKELELALERNLNFTLDESDKVLQVCMDYINLKT